MCRLDQAAIAKTQARKTLLHTMAHKRQEGLGNGAAISHAKCGRQGRFVSKTEVSIQF